jgi:hypothetical protein
MKPAKSFTKFNPPSRKLLVTTAFILLISTLKSFAQPECMPWGNIRSFHVDGEKMVFETSIRSVKPDWQSCVSSERCNWQGEQTYSFDAKVTRMSHFLQALPLNYAVTTTETSPNSVVQEITIDATAPVDQAGTYYCFEVLGSDFVDGTIDIYSGKSKRGSAELKTALPKGKTEYIRAKGNRIVIKSLTREYEVIAGANTEIFVKQSHIDRPNHLNDPLPVKKFVSFDPLQPIGPYQIYFTVIDGKAQTGDKRTLKYTINVKGTVDKEDVKITIDPTKPGRPFKGVGSNYRVHNVAADSAVVNYCLNNIRVSWGRIEFNWREWHAKENLDPLANARAGKLSKEFYQQIEMAKILARKNIPMIVTIWAPPAWAIDSTKDNHLPLEHDIKVSLNAQMIAQMKKSVADYLEFMKTDYGIEFPLFSFNEIDYGVWVYMTPDEHAFYNKEFGSYFASRGLATKMLLGDTGAGTMNSNKLVLPTVANSELHKYIGAVGFHTWHGCTTADMQAWLLSAQKLNLPLMAVEGGPNSALHRYPNQFLEKWFQLSEIDLYVRICRDAQVATIMEWQLTPNYSVLTGNGLYGDNGPLRPTQRFWNLKQLGATPEGSFWIPCSVDRPNISAAATADILNGLYTIHLVNNSATRKATITNIPAAVKSLNVYKTDYTRGMQKAESVPVKNGSAEVVLESTCYTTLTNAKF